MDINAIPNIVKLTLGAKGKTVILPNGQITKDGVSVAKAFKTKSILDEVIKQTALKTLEDVGDGTTSSLVLMQSIYYTHKNKSLPRISKQLEEEFELINSIIKSESKPIKTKKDLYNVAYISSNGDEEISKNVSEVCHKIGKDGNIMIEYSSTKETHYKIDSGFVVNDGVISPNMLKGKSEIFYNPLIMVCKDEIRSVSNILKIINTEVLGENKRSFIIVCDKVDTETVSAFITNRIDTQTKEGNLKQGLDIAIVSTTDTDDLYKHLGLVTDSTVLNQDEGFSSYDIQSEWLGTCEKVILELDKTVFVHDKTSKDKPKTMKQSKWDGLISKVATLYIGSNSRLETGEKKDRYDDSLKSCMSSYKEGFAKGGGYIWLKASEQVKLLRKPMESVFRQMCKNAGYSKFKTDWLIARSLDKGMPYNFKSEDWNSQSVFDSAKVLRISLESAFSISKLLLNTATVMGDDNNE
jgi:chaperonin GroEL